MKKQFNANIYVVSSVADQVNILTVPQLEGM